VYPTNDRPIRCIRSDGVVASTSSSAQHSRVHLVDLHLIVT